MEKDQELSLLRELQEFINNEQHKVGLLDYREDNYDLGLNKAFSVVAKKLQELMEE